MKQHALITGAGTGIGRALCERLIKKNHEVIGVGRRPAPLEKLKQDFGQSVTTVEADVGTVSGRNKIHSVVKKQKLDLLVHNAAVLDPVGPISKMKRREWQKHFQINFEGPVFLTQKLLPCLGTGSRILNISSGAAHRSIQGWAAYCMSKAALHMSYECWKEELSGQGILVGSVKPGVVDTAMQEQIRNLDEERFPMLENFRSLKRNNELLDPNTVSHFLAYEGSRRARTAWGTFPRLVKEVLLRPCLETAFHHMS